MDETARTWDYNVIRDAVTDERLRSYLRACGGDLDRAFELYEWNVAASEAVLGLIAKLEVVVRNAVDRELQAWALVKFGTTNWFDHVRLDPRGQRTLLHARGRASDNGRRPERHGKVIAELSFGFWRQLLESRYFTAMWVPVTNKAFSDGATDLRVRQREVAVRMRQLNLVRNRAAPRDPENGKTIAPAMWLLHQGLFRGSAHRLRGSGAPVQLLSSALTARA